MDLIDKYLIYKPRTNLEKRKFYHSVNEINTWIMKIAEKSKFYKLRLLGKRINHGLFLFTLRNALTRFGLDIEPYYWFREVENGCDVPEIRDVLKDYRVVVIGIDEIKIMDKIMGLDAQQMEHALRNGQICVGLKQDDEIATLLFIDLHAFTFKKRFFKMENDNEGYLLNVYTFQAYRGKNLAAYLRYHCFEFLEKQGVNELYSITSYFNTSSLKVNKKLNAKKLNLYLYIGLFKKHHYNIVLRNYSK